MRDTGKLPPWAILCRYGELFLKGDNRSFFERKLVDQTKRVALPIGGEVHKLHGRVLVVPRAERVAEAGLDARLLAALQHVFGYASFSIVRVAEKQLEAVTAAAVEEVRAALQHGRPRS